MSSLAKKVFKPNQSINFYVSTKAIFLLNKDPKILDC